MTYTGHADVGGPAQVRELPDLVISKIAVGALDNNCYLLRCRHTGQQLLIDPAADAAAILALVGADGVAMIALTHGHADHWQALEEVVRASAAVVLAHPSEAADLPLPLDMSLADGDVIEFGAVHVRVIHVRGHTAGSLVFAYDDPEGHAHLFTGDSLFPGGVGNTWGDADCFAQLIDDVEHKVFEVFSDETWVYPGHGDDTILGRERPSLAQWRERGW